MRDPSEGFLPPLELPPDPDNDRRSYLKKAGFVGVAAAAATTGGAPYALANAIEFTPPSPQAAPLLPVIGQTANLSCNAFGTTLFVSLPPPLPVLNLTGSIAVKTLIGGTDFVRLQVQDLTMDAVSPMFGTIALRQPDIDASPQGTVSLGPGGLRLTLVLTFNAVFQRCGDSPGPFEFATLQPARLTADLPQFPPPRQTTNPDGSPAGGALCRLTAPVSLGTIDSSGLKTEFAQLQGMNINIGQLA